VRLKKNERHCTCGDGENTDTFFSSPLFLFLFFFFLFLVLSVINDDVITWAEVYLRVLHWCALKREREDGNNQIHCPFVFSGFFISAVVFSIHFYLSLSLSFSLLRTSSV